MLYVQQSLADKEKIIHIGQFHWMYDVVAFFQMFMGVFLAFMIIFGSLHFQSKFGINLGGYALAPDAGLFDTFRALHPAIKLVAFLFFLFGVLRFAQMMVTKATTEIAITNLRMIYKRGLVARAVIEMRIDRIESVDFLQGILGRIFVYGRVRVHGMGVGNIILPALARPIIIRKAIEKARDLNSDIK